MRLMQTLRFFCTFTGAILAAQPALAGMVEFTYTSTALPWASTIDKTDPDAGAPSAQQPSFSFSFTAPDSIFLSSGPTKVVINEPKVTVNPLFTGNKAFKTASKGSLTVNPDGSISAWDIDLKLTEITTPTSSSLINYLKYSISIFTSSGEKTCDCDLLRTRFNKLAELPNRWNIVGSIDVNYEGLNMDNNWSVKKIPVPEPSMGLLVFAGLGLISFLRLGRKRKKNR